MIEKYENTYRIKYNDVDKSETATVNSIMEYMQEASSEHTQKVGCTTQYMKENGIAWILIQSVTNIYLLPKLGDSIIVRTWSCGIKGIYAYRKYEIINEENNIIAQSNSKWIMYSTEKNRPIKVPEQVQSMYVSLDDIVTDNFIAIKDNNTYDNIVPLQVLYRDVDTNWHMNNVKYVKVAIESMNNEFLNTHTVEKYSAKYIKQLVYNEKFNVCITKISDDEYMYYINTEESSNKNNCEIYIKWKLK